MFVPFFPNLFQERIIGVKALGGTQINLAAAEKYGPNILRSAHRHFLIAVRSDIIEEQSVVTSQIKAVSGSPDAMHALVGKRMFLEMRIEMVTVIGIQATLSPHPHHAIPVLGQTQYRRSPGNSDISEAVILRISSQ